MTEASAGKGEHLATPPWPTHDQLSRDIVALTGDWSAGSGGEYFVGQDEARQQLSEFLLTAPEGSIAFVEAPFGTGKTTLLYTVFSELRDTGLLNRYVAGFPSNDIRKFPRDFTAADVNGYGQIEERDSDTDLPILFIEEIGRGAEMDAVIEIVNSLRRREAVGRVILTGEETLREPALFRGLGVSEDEITRIRLDHTDSDQFVESLRRRLNANGSIVRTPFLAIKSLREARQVLESLEAKYAGTDGPYTTEFVMSLFDRDFLNVLTYPTDPPSFQFREARVLVHELLSSLRPGQKIDGDYYKDKMKIHERSSRNVRGPQRDVLSWLHQHIREVISSGQPFAPISPQQVLRGLLGGSFDFDPSDVGRLFERAIIYKGSHGFRTVNTSEFDETRGAFSARIGLGVSLVPKPETFLDAIYDPVDPNPDTTIREVNLDGSPQEQARDLFDHYVHGGVNVTSYRSIWRRLVSEQLENT